MAFCNSAVFFGVRFLHSTTESPSPVVAFVTLKDLGKSTEQFPTTLLTRYVEFQRAGFCGKRDAQHVGLSINYKQVVAHRFRSSLPFGSANQQPDTRRIHLYKT